MEAKIYQPINSYGQLIALFLMYFFYHGEGCLGCFRLKKYCLQVISIVSFILKGGEIKI